MLEAIGLRRASRARGRPVWGPVDAILALVLLPFALSFFLIDRLVAAIGWLLER